MTHRSGSTRPTKRVLHLGCGTAKLHGALGVDIRPFPGIDVVHDLNQVPWPFEDEAFDRVRAYDILEHVRDMLACMVEIHRVCRDGALVEIRLPFMGSVHAATDPTHLRAGTSRTFDYFDPNRRHSAYGYSPANFKVLGFRYRRGYMNIPVSRFFKRLDRFLLPLCERNHDAFEFYFAGLYPVHNVEYALRVVKERRQQLVPATQPEPQAGSMAQPRAAARRPVVAMVHSAFDGVGGAEMLAVAQGRLLYDAGAAIEMFALRWTPSSWQTRLQPLAMHAHVEREEDAPKPALPSTVTQASLDWLSARLWGCSLAIGHNFPGSAALAGADFAGPRIWYCHEPPRDLHVWAGNPTLTANLGIANLRYAAMRHFARYVAFPAAASSLVRGRHAQLRTQDLGLVSRFNAIWSNSEFTRDNLRSLYGAVPIEVVHPVVSVAPSNHRSGLRRDRLTILCLSRLEPHKNVEVVVAAVGRLTNKRRVPVSLHVVGEGPELPALQRYVRVHGLGDTVHLHGYLPLEAVDTIASACDVFALLPLDEPFGMVFPEAMLRGLLVVGPDHGGPLEVLDGGNLGFVANAFSIDSIVEAFERVWSLRDAEADALRERAARSCNQRFAPEPVGRRMCALLKDYGVELPART